MKRCLSTEKAPSYLKPFQLKVLKMKQFLHALVSLWVRAREDCAKPFHRNPRDVYVSR